MYEESNTYKFSELAYGHAMKKHIAFPTIDKMNKLIHGYYSKSPKRTSFLDNYMKTMGETSFRISPSIQTRYILYFRLVLEHIMIHFITYS